MFDVNGKTDISFIVKGDFWPVDPSGNYGADCTKGREMALELQRHMMLGNMPNLLGSVAKAIMDKGRWTGLEIGFFHMIGDSLSRGAGLAD